MLFSLRVLVTTLAFGSTLAQAPKAKQPPVRRSLPTFETQRLAPDVYVVSPTAPLGFGMDPNSLVVVGDNGILVVDAQFSASASEAVIQAVRKISPRPVRWLVNTHWHDDHVSGNATWLRAFPGLSIVGLRAMREGMRTDGAKNRADFLKSVKGTAGYLRDLQTKRVGIDGKPTDSTELTAFQAYVTLIERFAAESLQTKPTPPTLVFDDSLTIHVGTHRVDLRFVGRAHTSGDLVVHLPHEGIIASGDIVVLPVPFVGSTSFPRDFGTTIERMLALNHTMIVPGHGPVLRDDTYPKNAARMLATIRRQVDSLRVAGDSLRTVRRKVGLDEFRALFAGGDRLKDELFVNYVLSSAIPKAFTDGAADKR